MKEQGSVFFIVSVWADWNRYCSSEPDFTKYEEISERLTTRAAVFVAVDLYKEQNKMMGEGYDHFFSVAEYVVDKQCESGRSLINDINYECWKENK